MSSEDFCNDIGHFSAETSLMMRKISFQRQEGPLAKTYAGHVTSAPARPSGIPSDCRHTMAAA